MDQKPIRANTTQPIGKKHKNKDSWRRIWQWIFRYDTKNTNNRGKKSNLDLNFFLKKDFHANNTFIKGKKTTEWEKIFASHISLGSSSQNIQRILIGWKQNAKKPN